MVHSRRVVRISFSIYFEAIIFLSKDFPSLLNMVERVSLNFSMNGWFLFQSGRFIVIIITFSLQMLNHFF